MDDMTLIFDPRTGVYHRVSRSGGAVLARLDGSTTADDIVRLAGLADDPERDLAFRAQLDGFLGHLERSGLLVGSALPDDGRHERRASSSRMMPRIVLTRALPRLLEPLAAVLRGRHLPLLGGAALLLAVAGFATGVVTLLTADGLSLTRSGTAFLAAAVLQLTLIAVHETAHALVAQVQRVPVRGLGVAMLFWFMPVAYVDRTDAYRLRGRGGRVAIALAGMTSDGIFCGLTAVAALATDGWWSHTFALLLVLQLIGLMINLNPLLPSDGYSALEAATGQVDFRGRAFGLVGAVVRRRPLPVHLATTGAGRRLVYVGYAAVSAAYVALAAVLLVAGVVHTTAAALAGVG
ncbi:hypothetical protein [Nocardioides zeae]